MDLNPTQEYSKLLKFINSAIKYLQLSEGDEISKAFCKLLNSESYFHDHNKSSDWHFFRNKVRFSDLVEKYKFEMYDVIIKLYNPNFILRQGQKLKLEGNEEDYFFLCAGHRFAKGSKRPIAVVIKQSNSSPELIYDFATVKPIDPPEIANISLELLNELMKAYLIKFPTLTQVRETPKRDAKNKVNEDPDFELRDTVNSIKSRLNNGRKNSLKASNFSSSSSIEKKQNTKKSITKKKQIKPKVDSSDSESIERERKKETKKKAKKKGKLIFVTRQC